MRYKRAAPTFVWSENFATVLVPGDYQSNLFHTQIFARFTPARETLVAVKRQVPTKQVTPANI